MIRILYTLFCSCGKKTRITDQCLDPAWAKREWLKIHAGPDHIQVDVWNFGKIIRARAEAAIRRGPHPKRERRVPGQQEAFTNVDK